MKRQNEQPRCLLGSCFVLSTMPFSSSLFCTAVVGALTLFFFPVCTCWVCFVSLCVSFQTCRRMYSLSNSKSVLASACFDDLWPQDETIQFFERCVDQKIVDCARVCVCFALVDLTLVFVCLFVCFFHCAFYVVWLLQCCPSWKP